MSQPRIVADFLGAALGMTHIATGLSSGGDRKSFALPGHDPTKSTTLCNMHEGTEQQKKLNESISRGKYKVWPPFGWLFRNIAHRWCNHIPVALYVASGVCLAMMLLFGLNTSNPSIHTKFMLPTINASIRASVHPLTCVLCMLYLSPVSHDSFWLDTVCYIRILMGVYI